MGNLRHTVVGLGASLALVLGMVVMSGAATAQAVPAPVDLQSASCPANVSQGQSSGCVVELQTLLKQHGYNPGTIDGIFGTGTLAAVKSFQSGAALTADGIVGTNTKAKLYTKLITVTSANCPATLTSGSRGGCVAYIQSRLNTLQAAGLVVDGKFGAASLAAVKTFQSKRCLTVDGIVGTNTKTALVNNTTQCSTPPPATPVCNTAGTAAAKRVCIVNNATAAQGQGWSSYVSSSSTPWCAAFASAILKKSGVNIPSTTWAPDFKTWAQANMNNLTWVPKTSTPVPGDLALWDWNDNGVPDHVNIVVSVNATTPATITAIGGNQGGGTGSVTPVYSNTSTAHGSTVGYTYGNLLGYARITA